MKIKMATSRSAMPDQNVFEELKLKKPSKKQEDYERYTNVFGKDGQMKENLTQNLKITSKKTSIKVSEYTHYKDGLEYE